MALYWTCEGLKFYAAGFLNFFFFYFFSFSFHVHIFTVILHSCNDLGLIHSQHFPLGFFFVSSLLSTFVILLSLFVYQNLVLRSQPLLMVLAKDSWREINTEL
jgi:hypothetical protein